MSFEIFTDKGISTKSLDKILDDYQLEPRSVDLHAHDAKRKLKADILNWYAEQLRKNTACDRTYPIGGSYAAVIINGRTYCVACHRPIKEHGRK